MPLTLLPASSCKTQAAYFAAVLAAIGGGLYGGTGRLINLPDAGPDWYVPDAGPGLYVPDAGPGLYVPENRPGLYVPEDGPDWYGVDW